VPESELLRIADEVEEEVFNAHDREVQTGVIGQLVTDRLRRLDQVAYVRFASVYRQFKTLEELVDEARAVLDARRYEDPPGQGRLFVEASAAPAGHEGDSPEHPGEKPAGRRVNGRRPSPAVPAAAAAPQAAPNGTAGGESE
jgi:transcriptional repressor NrdR